MSQIGGDGPTPAGERPIRRWRFSLWYIPLVLVLILVVAVLAWRWYWQHEFDKRVAVLAAAGYPMTPAELDASYTWPASGDNAADWVVGAGSYFVELPRKEGRTAAGPLRRIEGIRFRAVRFPKSWATC